MAFVTEPRAIVDGSDLEEQPAPTGTETAEGNTTGTGKPAEDLGWLLTAPEPEVAKRIDWFWTRQDKPMKNRFTLWKYFRGVRKGVRFSQIRREQDALVLYVPPQTGNEPPEPNNADDLARNVVSVLMADPPVADAEPATDSAEDRQAAEFTTRVLNQEASEGGVNIRALHEDALDKSSTYCSAFPYLCVDPHGGGWNPMKVLAHPKAIDSKNPLVNPETGQEEPPYTVRYAKPDGSLTDEASEAGKQWLPSIRVEILTGHHVRFIPETCTGIGDAEGVVLCMPTVLGVLRSQFEKADAPWTDEYRIAIAKHRPDGWEEMLPAWMKGFLDERTGWHEGKPTDDAVCFPYLHYRRRSQSYPYGAYLVTVGKERLLHRQKWSAMTIGQQGEEAEETLDIPLAQVRQLDDHADGDPYGSSFLAKTGPMDEIVASIIGGLLEHLDRFNHAREYLPLGSNVTPEIMRDARATGIPILFNGAEGKPEFETIPPFPKEGPDMVQYMTEHMRQTVGLSASAQGQRDPNVQSGRHFEQMVEQSLVRLASVKHNSDDGFIRLNRIYLQLMRAFYTLPQRLKYLGDDGRYKERSWSRTDLGSTKDVRIRRGTSTLLPRSAKMALAREELDVGLKAQDPQAYTRYQAAIAGHYSPVMGLQDDPAKNRVRQQIADWEEGPDEEVEAASQQYQEQLPMLQAQLQQQMAQMQEQAMMAEAQGMMAPPMQPPAMPVDPMTEAAAKFFAPLPADDDPLVARTRYEALGAAMQSVSFVRQPQPWQEPFIAEYLRMRMAAGVQTVADQQAAMQQQAMMQQQAQATEQEFKSAEAEKDRAVAADTQAQNAEQGNKKMDLERQRAALQAAARIATAPQPAQQPVA